MGTEHAAQIRRRERPQPVEIGPAVLQISDHHLGHAKARRLARHGLPCVDLANHGLAHRFGNEPGGKAARRAAQELAFNRGARSLPLAGVTRQRDQEESGRAGIPRLGIDAMHEPRLLADRLPQDRTVAAAQNGSEHIECRRIGVRESGNLPGKFNARELHIFEQVADAPGQLQRLNGQRDRRQPRPRHRAEMLGDRSPRLRRVKCAGHHHDQVVGHVTRVVVTEEVVARQGGEHLPVADDGMTVAMLAERRGEQGLAQAVIRIVLTHVDLAQDNLAFPRHFLCRQRGVKHGVREDVDRDSSVLGGQIHVVNRSIKRRVRIDVPAMRLNGQRNLTAGTAGCALEQHVLQEMRQAGAEICPLVNAAGFHPDLNRGDGGGAVGLQQNRETVGQDQALGRNMPETVEQRAVGFK